MKKIIADELLKYKLTSLINTVKDYAFIFLDTEGNITNWNKGAERIKGYTEEEILGKNFSIFYTKESIQENHPNNELKIAQDKGHYEEEGWRVKKDGSKFWASVTIISIYDNNNHLIGFGKITRDLTERKNLELQLKQKYFELQQSEKRAEHANKAKSSFLASMSHEIRTPLNGIIGITAILLDDKTLTTEQRESVEIIRISGESLLTVINDVLDFSKIESGKIELEAVDFDLKDMINNVTEIIAMQIHKKGVEIGADIDTSIPSFINGDPFRLRQILTNLLGNAAKFTATGYICLSVKLINKINKKIELLFEVIDTGIGITSKIKSQLFQPFTQGSHSITRKYGGTGLGLTISKHLVELMGGKIDIKKMPNGSNFWFSIVVNQCIQPKKNKLKNTEKLKGRKVLCVDDNHINLEIIKHYIESYGMHCDLAENAESALNLLKKSTTINNLYSVIIIDAIMPKIDGFELAKAIRKNNKLHNIPVIMLSSLGLVMDAKKMKQAGISFYLTKPIRQTKLYSVILNAINNNFPMYIAHKNDFISSIHNKENISTPILVAEDNSINQLVATRILNKLGFEVDLVENGQQTLKAFNQFKYQIILMDCQMPEMDGYTTTKEIRKIEEKLQLKPIIIIAMTANAFKGEKEKCLNAGMNDYITKPIVIGVLSKMLDKWLFKKS